MQYYTRALENLLKMSKCGRKKVILLFGARQCGKTTLFKHIIKTDKCVNINLQDRVLRRRYEADEGLLIRELRAIEGNSVIFIDEVQKVPDLLDDIQLLYDENPEKYQFYLTGSSARKLKHDSANLLPGRSHHYVLSPVMQVEQRKAIILSIDFLSTESRFPIRSLDNYLLYGNLPGYYGEDINSWKETLKTYADLYLENEIRQENIVGNMGAFARFLKIAAMDAGQVINYSKMASVVGVAVNTLRNFYQVLEDTFVGIRIRSFSSNRKRITAAPRFIFFDIGVRHILADLPLNPEILRIDGGHIFEQWVLAELYYRCLYHGPGYNLSTWRTKTGVEVDAVVETPDRVIPIEIKWTDKPHPHDARHVEKFITEHSYKCDRGFVVCRTPINQQLTERVTALPWNIF